MVETSRSLQASEYKVLNFTRKPSFTMDEQNIASVRNKLNSENIKLWLPPYTVDGSEGNFPTEMVERYAAELKLDVIVVLNVLRNLRNHAVTKLASNQKFKTTGVATLKVKIVNPQQKSPPRKEFESIEINLDENGKKLRELVASKCSVDSGKIKLISAGKVIQDTCSLKDQSVKVSGIFMYRMKSPPKKAQQTMLTEQNVVDIHWLECNPFYLCADAEVIKFHQQYL